MNSLLLLGNKMTKQFDEKKEKGAAQIIIPNKLIFAGKRYSLLEYFVIKKIYLGFKSITCRLDDDPAIPKTIADCFVNINFENHQFLSEALANQFNPLTITISHVENMPSTPVSFAELKHRLEFCFRNKNLLIIFIPPRIDVNLFIVVINYLINRYIKQKRNFKVDIFIGMI